MPTSFSQVLILLVFIVPGFLAMRVKRVAYPSAEPTAATAVLDSLALSCMIYALTFPLLYLSYVQKWYKTDPVSFALLALFVLLAMPCILGVIYVWSTKAGKWAWLRGSLGFPHPDPTAWDHHFRKGRAYWIWLTFKSGQVMAGLYGPNSFASSFPQRQDLFVEKLLSLDENGNVMEWKDGSAGALINMESLERIEFFEIEGVTP
ncbi:MAG: DUF6338 family protein [Terriglobia bacterium]